MLLTHTFHVTRTSPHWIVVACIVVHSSSVEHDTNQPGSKTILHARHTYPFIPLHFYSYTLHCLICMHERTHTYTELSMINTSKHTSTWMTSEQLRTLAHIRRTWHYIIQDAYSHACMFVYYIHVSNRFNSSPSFIIRLMSTAFGVSTNTIAPHTTSARLEREGLGRSCRQLWAEGEHWLSGKCIGCKTQIVFVFVFTEISVVTQWRGWSG